MLDGDDRRTGFLFLTRGKAFCSWSVATPWTRQPVDSPLLLKGDTFEIEIFEAKRQNAGICGTCQNMFATWTFISIGRRVTQVQKNAFRLRGEFILFFECLKKNIRNLWFSSFPCKHPPDHPSIFLHLVKHQCQSAFGKAAATVFYSSRTLSHPPHRPRPCWP